MPKTIKDTKKAKKAKKEKKITKKLVRIKASTTKKTIKSNKTGTKLNKIEQKKEKSLKIEELIKYSKQNVIEKFAQKSGDTGSPEVQVAIATQKIYKLTRHLDENPKDNHSRRGLLKIIAKRRRLLSYLQDKDNNRYKGLIVELGLKK